MGIEKKTIEVVTCDMCGKGCEKSDGKIKIQVDIGDGRDVGPAFIEGYIVYEKPYVCTNGLVCEGCKILWLKKYVSNLELIVQRRSKSV